MSNRLSGLPAAFTAIVALLPTLPAIAAERPNIVFILADENDERLVPKSEIRPDSLIFAGFWR